LETLHKISRKITAKNKKPKNEKKHDTKSRKKSEHGSEKQYPRNLRKDTQRRDRCQKGKQQRKERF